MTFGIVPALLGPAVVGSRWAIKPASAAVTTQAAATLTPEQREQAMVMYLEAQKRSSAEQ